MFGFSFGIGLDFVAVFEVDSDVFVLPYSVIFRGTRSLCIGELELFRAGDASCQLSTGYGRQDQSKALAAHSSRYDDFAPGSQGSCCSWGD